MEQCFVIEVPGGKVLLAKLDVIYPECKFLIKDTTLPVLGCFKNGSCPRNANCFEKLAKRLKFLFDKFPKIEMIVLYFKESTENEGLRGGVFWRNFDNTRYIKINQSAFDYLKKVGTVYEVVLPDSLFMLKSL